jgi:hypothetical protein
VIFDSGTRENLFSLNPGEFFNFANIYGPYEDREAQLEGLMA